MIALRPRLRSSLPLVALWLASCAAGSATHAPTAADAAQPAVARGALEARGATVVDRLLDLGRRDNRVDEHLRYLTRVVGPRLTGSHDLEAAQRGCRDRFASWGLDASIETWGSVPVGFDRGPRSGGMVAPVRQAYEFTTSAWTPGTDGPRRGPALAFPLAEAELEALRPRLAGAWLVRPTADQVAAELERSWIATVGEALVEAGGAGEVRSSGGDLVHTGGRYAVEWDDLPRKVSITLRGDQHQDLFERVARGEPVELEFDVDNRFYEGPVEQHNVVADLVGTELPDEYVIVCAHLDSWDGAEGCVDNGTGVATTLEAARLLAAAGARPRRTIRFILWSGEEQGLLGSRAWVEQHADLLPRISAVFNHDEGTNYLAGLHVTPEMAPQLEAACAPVFDLDPTMPFRLQSGDGLPAAASSDHASFVRAGVPGFFWIQEGRSDYEHQHHTQYDTLDAAIPEYQHHSALVVALTAYGTAELPDLLDRTNMAPIPDRKMGVQLDGTVVRRVLDDGMAARAGWQRGDVILSVDGQDVADVRAVVRELQAGGPEKSFLLRRGEETFTTVLDYSDDPGELERVRRREARNRPGN